MQTLGHLIKYPSQVSFEIQTSYFTKTRLNLKLNFETILYTITFLFKLKWFKLPCSDYNRNSSCNADSLSCCNLGDI